jgi:hypothetical protein
MPLKLPCAGYPSQTAAVRAFAAQGKSAAEIVGLTGLSIQRVCERMWSGKNPDKRKAIDKLSVNVPHDVLIKLEWAAEARGMKLGTLMRELLTAISDDDLFDAVLDKGGSE